MAGGLLKLHGSGGNCAGRAREGETQLCDEALLNNEICSEDD